MLKHFTSHSVIHSVYIVVGCAFLFGLAFMVMQGREQIPTGQLVKYSFIFIVVVCLPAAVLDYYYISQRQQVIQYLTGAEKDLSAGNWERRMPHVDNAEFMELIDEFNAMAEQIEKTVKEATDMRLLFETLVDNSINGVIVIDPEGILLYANPAAINLLEMKSGKSGSNYVEAIQEYEVINIVDQARNHNQRISKKLTMHVLHGKTVHLTALPLLTSASTYIGIMVIINDIY